MCAFKDFNDFRWRGGLTVLELETFDFLTALSPKWGTSFVSGRAKMCSIGGVDVLLGSCADFLQEGCVPI